MSDFETNPIGTAVRITKLEAVIARLVEAGTNYHNAIEGFDGRGGMLVKIETVNKCGDELRAALAAAKAVQHE